MKRFMPVLVFAAFAAVLLAPALSGANGVSYTPMIASQRFVWQQPTPQGNPLKHIDFVSDVLGWAVGDNGVVLKTTDGGISWVNQGLIVEQGEEMYTDEAMDVRFVDASNGWIAIGPHVYRTTNGGASWAQTHAWSVNPATSKYYLYQSADFADANHGWFIGSYQMFHTTDGGSTVTSQALPAGATPFYVDALSSTQAWAYVYFDPGYVSTDDGGSTWNRRYFTGTAHEGAGPDTMAIANSTTQYATVGGDLLKTVNGGSTWTTMTVDSLTSPGDYLYQVWIPDGDTSGSTLYASIDGRDFHKSIDGGDHWTKVSTDFRASDLDIPSANTLFRVSYDSRVWGSTNAGASWYPCFGEWTGGTFSAMDFTSETTGYAITGDEIASTSDGGTTWQLATMADKGIDLAGMQAMTFLESDPNIGWIAGAPPSNSGLPSVYKTTDAGATWHAQEETSMAGIHRMVFADAENGWAVDAGQFHFWHSSDGGDTWQRINFPNSYGTWDLDFVDEDHGWIPFSPPNTSYGVTIASTDDGGSTWTTQTVGGASVGLVCIDFVDASNGFAADVFGHVFKTADGGDTWSEVPLTPYAPTWRISDIKFTTPLDGWVVGYQNSASLSPSYRHDFAAHTTDGGLTWDCWDDADGSDRGSTGTKVTLIAVESYGDETWIGGGNGTILKYRHRPITTITSASKVLSAYGQSAVVTGTVEFEGAPLAGRRIDLYTCDTADGVYLKSPLWTTTTAEGTFSITVAPTNATYYRAQSAEDGLVRRSAQSSSYVKITPRPSVGSPKAPSKMTRNKYYTVYGYLKPRHSKGTYPVRIYKYRKVSGHWKSYGYVKAKAADYSSGGEHFTKFSVKMRLTKSGSWRLRAYAPADSGHAEKWSPHYDYVKVP